ncbi:MAG: cyclopropane fatty acyl phospholipid synthase [Gammaproteobacteria bacterium]|nr:cyclopropane fatty acyl phospholipid synthase [Gammaproteobacteria bacterium]
MNKLLAEGKAHHLDHDHSSRTIDPPSVLVELLKHAGIRFDGPNPWDIQVRDGEIYQRILTRGSLGFGEAYMDGLWDCPRLDELFDRLLSADTDLRVQQLNRWRLISSILRHKLINLQSPKRAFQVGERHYDIGNDIFEAMLDETMSYSCGYWEDAENLNQAQQHKLQLICEKLQLEPGERLLDIGCGWGGLAHYAATNYDVEVLGITVSAEQQQLARQRCAGLPVRIELTDYRDLRGKYDKVVSVGMFEHVGLKNYATFFNTVQNLMSRDGLFLLHTIGNYRKTPHTDPWIEKYIFPNGKLPAARQLSAALERSFLIEDWHNFGQDYDRTLMAWWENFERAWPSLRSRYDERFWRMWRYYLLSCAGYFRSRQGQLWQLVLTGRRRRRTYRSIRIGRRGLMAAARDLH